MSVLLDEDKLSYRVSHVIVGLAGLTLIRILHHLAQLPSNFYQITISLGWIGQTEETQNPRQNNPGYEQIERTVKWTG